MGAAEGYIENYLREQCEAMGMVCLKFVSPGNRGVPDDVVIAGGSVVFTETKSATGRLQADQVVMHERMRAAGADVRVVSTRRAVDLLVRELASIGTN